MSPARRTLGLLVASVFAASFHACSDVGPSTTTDGASADTDGGPQQDGSTPDAGDTGSPADARDAADASDGVGNPDATPPPDATGGTCPLDATARGLVQDTLHKHLMDLTHTAAFTHDNARGLSFHLVGVEAFWIGFLSTLGPCTEPTTFDPYCDVAAGPGEPDEAFYQDHNRCSRLRCEGAAVGLTEIYFTQKPEMAPDARHPFTYVSTSPPGMGVYDPNPFITFRTDQTDPTAIVTTSDLDLAHTIIPDGEAEVDLSHTGTLRAVGAGEKQFASATAQLSFPALAGGEAVDVEVDLGAELSGTGSIVQGDRTLATISGTFALDMPLTVVWQDDCGR